MQLEGSYQFDAPPQAVWDALMDPTVLSQALPGGEQMEQTAENEYRAIMNVRVGPVQGKFQGHIELSDIAPFESYRMKVNGQGAPGFVAGEGTMRLEEIAAGTMLHYAGDVQIGGRIAGVSQRLVDSTAKSLTRQGLEALDQHIQLRLAPPAPASAEAGEGPAPVSTTAPSPPRAPAGPTTTDIAAGVARDVARDLAADYVPPQHQEKVLYALLGAAAMLLFVILVRLVQR